MDAFNNISINILQKSLDASWKKIQVISDNISNYETPGYKAKYISFQDQLKQNIESIKQGKNISSKIIDEIDNTNINIMTNPAESARLDGNNVQIDVEQLELLRTQYEYQSLTKQINDQFTRLRAVIEGR